MTRLGHSLYLGTVGLVLGGIVHLAATLAIPALASPTTDDRLAVFAPHHHVTLLPRAAPDGAQRHRDPAIALGVCRYDLSKGALRVSATSLDGFLSLAFYTPTGSVYYALTDRSAVRGALDIVVVTREQLEALIASDPDDEPVSEVRLVAPRQNGFVTFRALAGEQGLMEEAEGRIRAARCVSEPIDATRR